jgi:hypothetical protein
MSVRTTLKDGNVISQCCLTRSYGGRNASADPVLGSGIMHIYRHGLSVHPLLVITVVRVVA